MQSLGLDSEFSTGPPKSASQVAQWSKNLPSEAIDAGEVCSIPGLGRSPGGGNLNPL